jgi:formamidopyrimidine-DNA glycosylase
LLPELPEVESVRRDLEPAMRRARFDEVIVRRANLRTPFPPQFSARLAGHTVNAVSRRAKYLLLELSSGDTLVMHLGMSGDFRLEPAESVGEPGKHDHVIFRMSSGKAVVFNDVRRFGFMDLVPPGEAERHPALSVLGPEPHTTDIKAELLARALKGRKTSLKAALLDQRVVAGLGNIYASEALHIARLSPRRRASSIATASGAPREAAQHLVNAIKQVLTEAIERAAPNTANNYRGGRFRVYDREGERCRRRGCPGVIVRKTQAGRSTFYCPVCQK